MFNYIKKYFSTKQEQKVEEPKPVPIEDNLLIISCDSHGTTKIKITVNNKSFESAKHFGEMLFLLNEGFYVQTILDVLNEIIKTEPAYATFIQSIINKWSTKVIEIEDVEEDLLNQPVISPTFFYKSAK